MKHLRSINGPLGVPVSAEDRLSQGDVSLRYFLKIAIEMLNEQTAGGGSKEAEHKSEDLLHLCWS